MTKITIITVTYNCVDNIEKTIKSVIDQDFLNLEYIIIDGGSNDGTTNIIKKYESYLSYYVSEKDNGIYEAMNKGIEKATGEIIAFLNAGDWYEDRALASVDEFYKKCNADVIYGDIILHTEKGEKIVKYSDNTYEELRQDMNICHQAVFVKTMLMKKFRFNTVYKVMADYYFLGSLFFEGYSFSHLSKVIVNYTCGGFSDVNGELMNRDEYDIHLNFYNRKYIDKTVFKDMFYEIFYRWIMQKENDWKSDSRFRRSAISEISKLKRPLAVFGIGKNGQRMMSIFDICGVKFDILLDNSGLGNSKKPKEVERLSQYHIIVTPGKDKNKIISQILSMGVDESHVFDMDKMMHDISYNYYKEDFQ